MIGRFVDERAGGVEALTGDQRTEVVGVESTTEIDHALTVGGEQAEAVVAVDRVAQQSHPSPGWLLRRYYTC